MQNFSVASAASAIRAAFGDKAAARQLAASAVETAAARTILHGDAALFRAMQAEAEARKGAAAKDMGGRILAAEAAAREAQKALFPQGRKGKASAEDTAKAEAEAIRIGAEFLTAINGDAEGRSNKAKEAAAARKAKAPAAEDGKAEGNQAPAAEGAALTLEIVIAQRDKALADLAKAEAEAAELRAVIEAVKAAGNIKAVRSLLAA